MACPGEGCHYSLSLDSECWRLRWRLPFDIFSQCVYVEDCLLMFFWGCLSQTLISEYKCLTSCIVSKFFLKTSKNDQDCTLGSSRLKPTNIEGWMNIGIIKLEKKKPIWLLHIKKQLSPSSLMAVRVASCRLPLLHINFVSSLQWIVHPRCAPSIPNV